MDMNSNTADDDQGLSVHERHARAVMQRAKIGAVNILIVEDSPTQAQRLQYILSQEGYGVHLAVNGKMALEMAREQRPTLVISDIVMPEMNGYELCHQIKNDPALSGTPVLLVTSLTDPQDVIRGLESRADNFILKPYDERYLIGRVKFALLNSELRTTDRAGMGVEIMFNGEPHFIGADRLQILTLLLSTYDAAMQRNTALSRAQAELREINRSLTQVNDRLAQESRERQAAEQRLRSILDNMNAFVGELTPDGVLVEANEVALKSAGLRREEVIGRYMVDTWGFSYSPEFQAQVRADIEQAASGVMVRRDVKLRQADGSLAPIDFMLVPVFENGKVTKLIPSGLDIASRKQAELAARKLNENLERSGEELSRFKETLDQALDCIFLFEPETLRFIYANRGARLMVGYSEEELLRMTPMDLTPWADEKELRARLAPLMRNETQSLLYETTHRHKGGNPIEVEILIQLVHREGRHSSFVQVVRDITERKRTEQSLMAAKDEAINANKAKDTFLATMSHEIRTPLNGLLGMLELLELSQLDDEQREMLEAARDSGRGMVRIIDDVLDHAKIQAGKLKIVPEPVAIGRLLTRVVNNFHVVASSRGLTLTQFVDPAISPALLTDPARLLQILGNLISNAIKFTHQGGVDIRADLVGRSEGMQTICFTVNDTGIGIDAKAQARLFHAFEQAGADTSRLYGGTGLGLAISRSLIEMMGGTVTVESTLGLGTTMRVTLSLPISAVMPTERSSRVAKPLVLANNGGTPGSADEGPVVLAVDDNPTNRKLLSSQLKALGVRSTTVGSGKEALALWRTGDYGLLITDCNMPHTDGYALSRAIRSIEFTEQRPRTSIIAWTANVLQDAKAKCTGAGMDDMLTKPAELAQLRAMLARWLPVAESELTEPAAEAPETTLPAMPSAASAPLAAPPLIDIKVLQNLVGDNPALISELLNDFRVSAANISIELTTAYAANDIAAVGAAAHKLKSAARSIGAMELGALCAEIEQCGLLADSTGVRILLPRFIAEHGAVDAYLLALENLLALESQK